MPTDQAKDLATATWDLTDVLAECPTKTGGSVWAQIVRHCSRGTLEQRLVTLVERAIQEYIASLTEGVKRAMWSHTETGLMNGGDATPWIIEDIEMDLENELLAEVLEQAFREGERQKRKRSRR